MPEEKEEKKTEVEKAPEAPKADANEIEEGKTFAAIGYLGPLFLIPLLAAKDNKFAQFHAKQAMVLFITLIICAIIATILFIIPVIGWFLLGPIAWLVVFIGGAVLVIMGIVKALQGEYWKIPILGGWAEQLNF
jgi:uncharacterized membrane protein